MKKNTMLTLDEKLIETAKTLGINLSGVAEKAIRQELKEKLRPSGKERVHFPRTEKLIVKNIGPFEGEKEIGFTSGFNLIIGANASGKSTLIECLRAGYSGIEPPSRNQFAEEDEESWIRVIPEKGMIEKGPGTGQGVALVRGKDDVIKKLNSEDDTQLTDELKDHLERFEDADLRSLSQGERELRELISQLMATWRTECYVNDKNLVNLDIDKIRMVMGFLGKDDRQTIFTLNREMEFEIEGKCNLIRLDPPEGI